MAQLNVFLYFLYFFLQKLGRNPRNTIDTSLDLGTILSKWTWPDRREEIGKTVEAVLEVLWPGQPEVKAAAEVSPQVSPSLSAMRTSYWSEMSLSEDRH